MKITIIIFISKLDEWLDSIRKDSKEYAGLFVIIIDDNCKVIDRLMIDDIINI